MFNPELIAKGRLVKTPEGPRYKGSLPNLTENGQDVYIINKDVFDRLVEKGLVLLLGAQHKMDEDLFSALPDSIGVGHKDNTESDLYLDRKIYYFDAQKEIWIRYASIGEQLDDERVVPGTD